MNKEFTHSILLEKSTHYHIGICSVTGQDFVPYLNEDISLWLDESMKQHEDYEFESNMNPYKVKPETEKVSIIFINEENAMAFKLRWL